MLSCSNLGCVSLLFVLLSFLLLCLYVSEQTRSKLPITTSFDLSLYQFSYIIGLLGFLSKIINACCLHVYVFLSILKASGFSYTNRAMTPKQFARLNMCVSG